MKTKEEVEKLLEIKPHLRDSDPKLIATYWFNELKRKNIEPTEINGLEFMKMFADSKLTNIKTIERMRRKLQEEQPNLRGKLYRARKETIQDQWKKDLGYGN
mgnify:FL=1|tara:strand:- start:822 stop:1127 length:306 start_codon:yes stop_codon:yes gene_type:complete